MKKNILITGVAGMIGSHLSEALLQKGYQVVGIDDLSYGKEANIKGSLSHPAFRFYKVNILDFDTLKILTKDIS